MKYVDDFLFWRILVLTGADVSVVDSDGHPVVQFAWENFWVDNHAYALKRKNGVGA